jgi:uncharacterized membrane protein YvlD (DUF360 family)
VIAFLVSWALAAVALLLADRLFSGVRLEGDFATALAVAAGFSVLQFLLGWFLFGLLGIATLGIGFLFHFVTQLVSAALVLKLTSALSRRFTIDGFFPALGTAMLLAIAGEIGSRLFLL